VSTEVINLHKKATEKINNLYTECNLKVWQKCDDEFLILKQSNVQMNMGPEKHPI
jgi:hypothetical protein